MPGETEDNGLNLWGSALRYEEGVLFVYDTRSIPGEGGVSFGAFAIVPAYLRRLNVNTGEVDNSVNSMEFIGEHHILVEHVVLSDRSTTGHHHMFSVIDLRTGEMTDLQKFEFFEGDDLVAYVRSTGC